jgi:hypothetical protein
VKNLQKIINDRAKGGFFIGGGHGPPKARHVAPGLRYAQSNKASKAEISLVLRAFSAGSDRFVSPAATRSASLRACPWLSYFAPLALCFDFLCTAFPVHFLFVPITSIRIVIKRVPCRAWRFCFAFASPDAGLFSLPTIALLTTRGVFDFLSDVVIVRTCRELLLRPDVPGPWFCNDPY